MRTVSDEDLADILGTCESTTLEFKRTAKREGRRGDAIATAVCAMANDLCGHGGGDILVGVDDAGDPVDGVDISDRALLALTDLRDDGRILDRPSLTVRAARYKGKPVVHLRVEASASPPVRCDGVVWVRPGPTTRRAGREDERVLSERRRSGDGPFDVRPMNHATREDLDIDLFLRSYLPSMVDPEVIEENGRPLATQMASCHLATPEGIPTALGLLTIGLDPSSSIPGAYVQFVRYEGEDLDAPVADDQELRQNLIGTAARLEPLLRSNLRTRIVGDGFRETPQPDYPLEALREVCMNALMHRNYETSYAPTRIVWFDDRIEVTNPGGPFGQVRNDNFDLVTDYRNPSLAAALKGLGYVNRFGRGIGRVRAALQRNGNPPAEFQVDDSSWAVILRRIA
ncbi:putative DNA binding domain-containing protein [Streptomyces violaceoruber]|uniref:ATP-binding protein n=1 Tax=Streptomyces violaceoruber TaxID=1935 RepID=UPI001F30C305|nr:ATP-binding protein [Streptomyces violaceoruber]MCF3171255.1 putative DNA binding domain-containing protein [Streptomyces violaceoruber]